MSFDVDVVLQRGEARIACCFATGPGVTALVGRSGAGKTSVLHAISGLLRPHEGRIAVGEHVLFDAAARVDIAPQHRACGFVFQDLRLFPHRRVRENLLYGWHLAPPQRRWLSLDEAVAFLDIAALLHRHPRTLSGGEAQRVAIGRALLSGPRFVLMDEPLTSLDAVLRNETMTVIERIRDELALPVLLVSHDAREVERLADHVVAIG